MNNLDYRPPGGAVFNIQVNPNKQVIVITKKRPPVLTEGLFNKLVTKLT